MNAIALGYAISTLFLTFPFSALPDVIFSVKQALIFSWVTLPLNKLNILSDSYNGEYKPKTLK